VAVIDLKPPASGVSPPASAPSPPRSTDGAGRDRLTPMQDLWVSLVFCAVTVASAAGFARVYSTRAWVGPVVCSALAVHLTGSASRWRRRGGLSAVVLMLLALWFVSAEILFPSSMQLGLPLLDAVHAARVAWHQGLQEFLPSLAPAPAYTGFVEWTAWGTGLVALATDWFALRRRSLLLGLAPPFLLFVACCLFGTPTDRGWTIGIEVVALVLAIVTHQRFVGHAGTVWLGGRQEGVSRWMFSGAALAGAITLITALLIVPSLSSDGFGPLGWQGGALGEPLRVTPSPIVDLQTRILDESDVPVFSVKSAQPSYWRLTSLDEFTGEQWLSSGQYEAVRNKLPGVRVGPGTAQVVETFSIQTLDSPWLPVAFTPESVSGAKRVTYDPQSASLLTEGNTANGQHYQVTAAENLSSINRTVLNSAPALTAANTASLSGYLALPPIPSQVAALARQITAAYPTEYQKALALQDYFHQSIFTYSTSPPEDSSTDGLTAFLFQYREGYCQQFAGSYGVLARAIGLPTRLAVGFTTGTEESPGQWQVTDADAHVWPEVWFPTIGWVPFEPTPASQIPGTTQYTGNTGGTAATPTPTAISAPTTNPESHIAGKPTGGTTVPPAQKPNRGASTTRAAHHAVWPWVALALAAAGMAWIGAITGGRRLRWSRRRARLLRSAGSPGLRPSSSAEASAADARTAIAWAEAEEWLAWAGAPRHPSETTVEWAERAGSELARVALLDRTSAAELRALGELASRCQWGPGRVGGQDAVVAETASRHVRTALLHRVGWRRRLTRSLDPRSAWRPRLTKR
jgi:transglutaminase-like putative cysteine protease